MLNGSAGGKVSVPESFDPGAASPAAVPDSSSPPSPRFGHIAALAGGLSDVWPASARNQRTCRLRRISASVQILEYAAPGRAPRFGMSGTHTCKSRLCPFCAAKWQRVKAEEIGRALSNWNAAGPDRVCFATVTMRHHKGMSLALMHRLQRDAWGHLWSGRAGQDAALELGGKPETVRAHDGSWSDAFGWHPHLHCLVFLQRLGVSDVELQTLLDERWPEALASSLRRMKRLVRRILAGKRCRDKDCRICAGLGPLQTTEQVREHDRALAGRACPERGKGCGVCDLTLDARRFPHECPTLRERATRVFGSKLIHRRRPLLDAVRDVSQLLKPFSEESIRPTLEHGVRVERAAKPEAVSEYLVKLGLDYLSKVGLELAGAGKLGRVVLHGMRPVVHYSLWEVAKLATVHGHPLRESARRAYRALFSATFGTQTVTFSSRERLGLGPDPYADGAEPPEEQSNETVRALCEIEAGLWDSLRLRRKHSLLVELAVAHERGVLASVPYVRSLAPTHGDAVPRAPPNRGPPPEERAKRRAERMLEAERRGGAVFSGAMSKLQQERGDNSLFREELRYMLHLAIGEAGEGASG